MKKVLLLLSFVGVISATVWGARAPLDARGQTLPTIDWIGAEVCRLSITSATNAIGCSTGTAIVYGVMFSSTTATNFVVFRDTATANITSTTYTVVYANGSNAVASGASTTQLMKFPVPIKFNNGVSVNMGAALVGVSEVSILYRVRNSTNVASE